MVVTGDTRLGSAERLTRRSEFQRAFDRGNRIPGRFMTLLVVPNDLQVARLGIVATRKLGSAVTRNRAKRLIREVFRRNKPAPGVDLVVLPRRELLDASFSTLEADYRALLRRPSRRQG